MATTSVLAQGRKGPLFPGREPGPEATIVIGHPCSRTPCEAIKLAQLFSTIWLDNVLIRAAEVRRFDALRLPD
jgi:hypothetical protein